MTSPDIGEGIRKVGFGEGIEHRGPAGAAPRSEQSGYSVGIPTRPDAMPGASGFAVFTPMAHEKTADTPTAHPVRNEHPAGFATGSDTRRVSLMPKDANGIDVPIPEEEIPGRIIENRLQSKTVGESGGISKGSADRNAPEYWEAQLVDLEPSVEDALVPPQERQRFLDVEEALTHQLSRIPKPQEVAAVINEQDEQQADDIEPVTAARVASVLEEPSRTELSGERDELADPTDVAELVATRVDLQRAIQQAGVNEREATVLYQHYVVGENTIDSGRAAGVPSGSVYAMERQVLQNLRHASEGELTPSIMARNRQANIATLLERDGEVNVNAVARAYDVSNNRIRDDIKKVMGDKAVQIVLSLPGAIDTYIPTTGKPQEKVATAVSGVDASVLIRERERLSGEQEANVRQLGELDLEVATLTAQRPTSKNVSELDQQIKSRQKQMAHLRTANQVTNIVLQGIQTRLEG